MHAPHVQPRPAGYAIAGIFAVCAGVELGRVVADAPWGAFTPLASHGVAVMLAALWIVAALTIALRDRGRGVELVAWTVGFPAALLLFIHGFVATWGGGTTSAGSRLALVYAVLAVGVAWLLRQAWGRGVVAPVPQPVPWRTAPRPAPARGVRPTFAHSR